MLVWLSYTSSNDEILYLFITCKLIYYFTQYLNPVQTTMAWDLSIYHISQIKRSVKSKYFPVSIFWRKLGKLAQQEGNPWEVPGSCFEDTAWIIFIPKWCQFFLHVIFVIFFFHCNLIKGTRITPTVVILDLNTLYHIRSWLVALERHDNYPGHFHMLQ